jgi:hypothetical protein
MLAALLLACVIDRMGQSGTSQLAQHAKQIVLLQTDIAGIARRVGQLEEITRARGQDEILKLETMEQIRQEVANLRGDVEVLQRGFADSSTAGQGFQEDTVARLAAAEARLVALEASLGVPASGVGPVTPPAREVVKAAAAAVAAAAAAAPPTTTTTSPPSSPTRAAREKELGGMTVKGGLAELCEARGVAKSGKKADVVARLLAAEFGREEGIEKV